MNNTKWPNSKQLYMMNGGNKLYIYKDGFADIYSATAEEEHEWAKEVISNYLDKIKKEEHAVGLNFAIEGLLFHRYANLEELLIQKMENAASVRKIVFATALWKIYKYFKSYDIIHQQFLQHPEICLGEVFLALIEFKNNMPAFNFLLECLEGKDDKLFSKAHTTISMWAYTGLSNLKNGHLLERLSAGNRYTKEFKTAIEELKRIVNNI